MSVLNPERHGWAGIRLSGGKEAEALFRQAAAAFAPEKIQEAILPAAVIVRDAAKRRVNYGTHPALTNAGKSRKRLKDLIFATKGSRAVGGIMGALSRMAMGGNEPAVSVIAGIDLKKAPHAHLVEFGTTAHAEYPKPGNRFQALWLERYGVWRRFVKRQAVPLNQHAYFRPAAAEKRTAVKNHLIYALKKLLHNELWRYQEISSPEIME